MAGPNLTIIFCVRNAETEPHNHFLCKKCGRLLDLELDMKSIDEVNRLAAENFDGLIESSSTLFYGECSDCIKKS